MSEANQQRCISFDKLVEQERPIAEKDLESVEYATGVEGNANEVHRTEIFDGLAQDADIDPPPNGGLNAWLQVAGSFLFTLNSWGIVNSFGVYQAYYETGLLNELPSNISWIGSIQAFLLVLLGLFVGPFYDAGHFQAIVRIGSFLTVLGIMMTSISTKYWQIVLAQGICIGLGSGCLFVPSFAIVSQYFSTRKALASGVIASGSSIGGIIYPIIFRQLQPQIGFAWTTRIIGFVALITLAGSCLVMRVRVLPKETRPFLEPAAFKELPYAFFVAGLFFSFVGIYIPIFYLQTYAIQERITNADLGFYMLPILNASSVFGRIILNFFADKTGPLNMLIPCAIASTVLNFAWSGIHNAPGLIVYALLYGFFSGAFVSLPPTSIISLTPNLNVVGTRMGMCFAVVSFGVLAGSPISGAILSSTGKWVGSQAFAAGSVVVGLLFLIMSRFAKCGSQIAVKA